MISQKSATGQPRFANFSTTTADDIWEQSQTELCDYLEEQASTAAPEPEIEIDSVGDCFGLIFRVWAGMRHLGNFYHNPASGIWIAEPFRCHLRFTCESPDEARDKIVKIALSRETPMTKTAAKPKPLKFKEALEILNSMHFGARVVRGKRCPGTKEIWWISSEGVGYHTRFSKETPWEEVIAFAKSKLPVWDKAMMFQVGDVVELDWEGRIRATVIGLDSIIKGHYILEWESPKGRRQEAFGNYDLKFFKKAIKVG